MKAAAWRYCHKKQVVIDGTFGLSTSRLLVWIALGVDETNRGLPVAMFLFSAPTGNKATHAGYDTQIIAEIMASWRDWMGERNGEKFEPAVALTDTDPKERGGLAIDAISLIESERAECLFVGSQSDGKALCDGGLKYLDYLVKTWMPENMWKGWSRHGREEAAKRIGISLQDVIPTTNHLESLNKNLKHKWVPQWQHSGHRLRFDIAAEAEMIETHNQRWYGGQYGRAVTLPLQSQHPSADVTEPTRPLNLPSHLRETPNDSIEIILPPPTHGHYSGRSSGVVELDKEAANVAEIAALSGDITLKDNSDEDADEGVTSSEAMRFSEPNSSYTGNIEMVRIQEQQRVEHDVAKILPVLHGVVNIIKSDHARIQGTKDLFEFRDTIQVLSHLLDQKLSPSHDLMQAGEASHALQKHLLQGLAGRETDDRASESELSDHSSVTTEDLSAGLDMAPVTLGETVVEKLQAGFSPLRDLQLCEDLRQVIKNTLESYIKEYHIGVPQSAEAFIVPDPYGVLQPGQIHFKSSHQPLKDPLQFLNPHTLTGDVLHPELAEYVDVIVLYIRGGRTLASLLAGGDVDGDTGVCVYDPSIVNAFHQPPLTPEPPGFLDKYFQSSGTILRMTRIIADMESSSHGTASRALQKHLFQRLCDSSVGLYSMYHENCTYRLR
ncbi:hypothetical protein EIP86_010999 [Pleurotus ostreatoroseus]|nr:hypothetical protein EIP86_010999 [Pleurotus ostreatoroseus]